MLNCRSAAHQRRRHFFRVERLGRLEAAEHLHVGDVRDRGIGIGRRLVFRTEQFGKLLRALGHLLVFEVTQVVVEVMHGVDALQCFRRHALGHHVGDEGVEDRHLLAEAHLIDLLEQRHSVGAELRENEDVRLRRTTFCRMVVKSLVPSDTSS